MLYYALVFLVIALVAAVLGFGGIAASAAGISKILFFVFLVLFIASAVFHTPEIVAFPAPLAAAASPPCASTL